ncbi:TPA: fimbria/pilus periplasmic chaperone [Enterobacter asburiae]|nr:fimbria/pilus periplasmic chaperone [Enterobacter asburiae]HDS3796615.1 fimbria/pilus periplasmic chaperone [Enterobacter asburiae]
MNVIIKTFLFSAVLASTFVQASEVRGVTVGGTRLIYQGGKKEVSLNVSNSDTGPYLIQSWAETTNGGTEKAPFIITPPLFRLDAQQQNMLRVVRAGGNLPEDRESLFWLNIKSIPSGSPTSNANTLQLSVKTRIKLIYRPQGIKGVPDDVAKNLTWNQKGTNLTVNNPTPFYMNFQQVKVGGREINNVNYVAPMSTSTFTTPPEVSGSVTWKVITDYGAIGNEHSSSKSN